MKKKSKPVLFFLASIHCLFFFSCKKNDDPVPVTVTPMIKTITTVQNGGTPNTVTYAYENTRVKTVTYPNGSRIVYRYTPDSAISVVYDPTNQPASETLVKLNSKGSRQELTINYFTTPPSFSYYESFEYNAENRATKATESISPLREYQYFYTGNKLDSVRYISGNYISYRLVVNEFETGISNTIGNANTGFTFIGKDVLPVKKQTRYYYSATGVLTETAVGNFSYETNSKAEIIKQTVVNVSSLSGTSTTVFTYTYY